MSDILLVALVCLATHRLTRLVVEDRILQSPRERVQVRAEKRWSRKNSDFNKTNSYADSDEWRSSLAYFLSCPWCASIWVGGLVVLIAVATIGLPVPVLVWLAASSVTGLLSSIE